MEALSSPAHPESFAAGLSRWVPNPSPSKLAITRAKKKLKPEQFRSPPHKKHIKSASPTLHIYFLRSSRAARSATEPGFAASICIGYVDKSKEGKNGQEHGNHYLGFSV